MALSLPVLEESLADETLVALVQNLHLSLAGTACWRGSPWPVGGPPAAPSHWLFAPSRCRSCHRAHCPAQNSHWYQQLDGKGAGVATSVWFICPEASETFYRAAAWASVWSRGRPGAQDLGHLAGSCPSMTLSTWAVPCCSPALRVKARSPALLRSRMLAFANQAKMSWLRSRMKLSVPEPRSGARIFFPFTW